MRIKYFKNNGKARINEDGLHCVSGWGNGECGQACFWDYYNCDALPTLIFNNSIAYLTTADNSLEYNFRMVAYPHLNINKHAWANKYD